MPPTQARKRRAQPVEDPPDPSPEPQSQRRRTTDNASDDEDADGDAYGAATQADGIDEMVKKMVRLALACEYQRKVIRRADISEKVLGSNGRQFKNVFLEAQTQLAAVFGMRMVELPARERTTVQQRRAAQNAPTQAKSTGTWILESILPPAFRNPEIIQPPAAPTSADDSRYTAVYTLLYALISLSAGTLPDAKMDRFLKRLNIHDTTPVRDNDKTEKLLKRLEKEGYVIKTKESTGTGEDDVYWTLGPRGKMEIGEAGVRGVVQRVFGDMETEAEEEELERKIQRSMGITDRPVERREPAATGERPKRGRKKREPREEEEEEEAEEEEEEEAEEEEDDDEVEE